MDNLKLAIALSALFALLAVAYNSRGADVRIAQHLVNNSVTVEVDQSGFGSGAVLKRYSKTGEPLFFVLTVGHVAGSSTNIVAGCDLNPLQVLLWRTQVLSVDSTNDLSLLWVYSARQASWTGVELFAGTPLVGQEVYSVSSPFGRRCSHTFSVGVISYVGRARKFGKSPSSVMCDQFSAVVYPGSSGGGVFLPDGRLLGLVVGMAEPGIHYMIPTRSIVAWVRREKLDWVIDPKLPCPTRAELSRRGQ